MVHRNEPILVRSIVERLGWISFFLPTPCSPKLPSIRPRHWGHTSGNQRDGNEMLAFKLSEIPSCWTPAQKWAAG